MQPSHWRCPALVPAGRVRLGRLIHKCLCGLEDLKSELK